MSRQQVPSTARISKGNPALGFHFDESDLIGFLVGTTWLLCDRCHTDLHPEVC
jgi:hypothetical protein